jgi:hypothetical protein
MMLRFIIFNIKYLICVTNPDEAKYHYSIIQSIELHTTNV